MHRGMATLGVHGDEARRSECQPLVDGKISVADLLAYADEFDASPGKYTARDFIVSLLPDVVGTDERKKHLEARASLIQPTKAEGEQKAA